MMLQMRRVNELPSSAWMRMDALIIEAKPFVPH